jgi:hypothetical protein
MSRTPALEAWRDEVAAGKRTADQIDPLWRAACCEADAAEMEAARLPALGAKFRREAIAILRRAARDEDAVR